MFLCLACAPHERVTLQVHPGKSPTTRKPMTRRDSNRIGCVRIGAVELGRKRQKRQDLERLGVGDS